MQHPLGLKDPKYPQHVCQLNHALYGLKQDPQAWFEKLRVFLLQLVFFSSFADHNMFISHSTNGFLVLLLYVDGMVVTRDNPQQITWLILQLNSQFSIKDLGFLHHFWGIEIHKVGIDLYLNQQRYIMELLTQANMFE